MKSAKHNIKYIGLLLLLLFGQLLKAQQIPQRPDPPRLVNDFEHLLTNDEVAILEQKLDSYSDSTSTQIVIVTIPSLEGAPVEDYAATLGQKWGVGVKGKHNGVVLLVSKHDRTGYIATGYGVEDGLNTNVCARIYQQIMVPNFRKGDFYAAFDEATTAITDVLAGKFVNDIGEKDSSSGIPTVVVILIVIFVIFLLIAMSRNNRAQNFSRRGSSSGWGPFFGGGGGGFGGFGGFGGGGSSSSGGGFGGFGGGSFSGGGSGGSW
ncbi:MAG: TPM domain-containing protein [Chitinophagales bacterium]